jgi:hypothetical protein
MAALKQARANGSISAVQFDQYRDQLKAQRQAEYDAAKRDLRAGKISRQQYRALIAEIRRKYEGGP